MGHRRRFLLSSKNGSCNLDAGWIAADNTPDNCAWENKNNTAPPVRILYGANDKKSYWNSALMGDTLVVLVR